MLPMQKLSIQKIVNILLGFSLFLLAACSPPPEKVNMVKPKSGTIHETYGYWFFTKDKDKCYIFSFPISSYGHYLNRNLHYILINQNKETLVYAGRNYLVNSKARLEIANISIFFDTVGAEAWTVDDNFVLNKFLDNHNKFFLFFSSLDPNHQVTNPNNENSNEIATAKENSEEIPNDIMNDPNNTNNKGSYVVDKYALDGFQAALNTMNTNCKSATPLQAPSESTPNENPQSLNVEPSNINP